MLSVHALFNCEVSSRNLLENIPYFYECEGVILLLLTSPIQTVKYNLPTIRTRI